MLRARQIESTGVRQQPPRTVDSVVLRRHWDDARRQVRSQEAAVGVAEPLREEPVVRHVRFAYD